MRAAAPAVFEYRRRSAVRATGLLNSRRAFGQLLSRVLKAAAMASECAAAAAAMDAALQAAANEKPAPRRRGKPLDGTAEPLTAD
jgi:hypothetical protein